MSIFFLILNLLVFGTVINYLYRTSGGLKKYVIPAVSFKVLCGLAIGVLYSRYYDFGDTWSFFNESSQLYSLAMNHTADFFKFLLTSSNDIFHSGYQHQPRALFFVKILAVVNLVSGNNYWLSSIYFSLFSFSGIWFLAKALLKRYSDSRSAIVFSLFIFPSAIFWSSGLIKESIATGCIGFILGLAVKIIHNKEVKPDSVVFLLINIFILWKIKYYYAGVIILLIATLFFSIVTLNKSEWISRRKWASGLIFFGIALFAAFFVSQLHPNFYLERFLGVLVDNYSSFSKISDEGDFVKFESLSASWLSILSNSPKALASGLFRPFIGESVEIFKIIAGIENLILLILCVTAIYYRPKKLDTSDFVLLLAALSFVIIMAVFLTLSAPNFGTLIRYKSGFLPIFIFLLTLRNPIVRKLIP